MMTAGIIRVLLAADIIAMALLALAYLRQRRMRWFSYCFWGFVGVAIPVIGPFLVIANHPGEMDPNYSIQQDLSRLLSWARRLLPDPPRKNDRTSRSQPRRQVRQ